MDMVSRSHDTTNLVWSVSLPIVDFFRLRHFYWVWKKWHWGRHVRLILLTHHTVHAFPYISVCYFEFSLPDHLYPWSLELLVRRNRSIKIKSKDIKEPPIQILMDNVWWRRNSLFERPCMGSIVFNKEKNKYHCLKRGPYKSNFSNRTKKHANSDRIIGVVYHLTFDLVDIIWYFAYLKFVNRMIKFDMDSPAMKGNCRV